MKDVTNAAYSVNYRLGTESIFVKKIMAYTTLSIRKNNQTNHYILSYANYLQEAWLSEINDEGKTKIVAQFQCRKSSDLNVIVSKIMNMGEVMNLQSDESLLEHLNILQVTLEKNPLSDIVEAISDISKRLFTRLPFVLGQA